MLAEIEKPAKIGAMLATNDPKKDIVALASNGKLFKPRVFVIVATKSEEEPGLVTLKKFIASFALFAAGLGLFQ